jgi:hypothetical protein
MVLMSTPARRRWVAVVSTITYLEKSEMDALAAFVQAGMPVPHELLTGVFGVSYGWRLVLRRALDVIDYKDFRRTGLWF